MSVLWTSSEAAVATGGKVIGDWSVSDLSIDTRSLTEGDLFVPLKDVRDGHDFIPMAYEKGAGAVISERPIENVPALIVKDSVQALRNMAIASRNRSKAIRIAVTGSVGKTSLKEAIATICEASGETHKSQKSFNNHWGVPFTLAAMRQTTKYGIFEVGMNHRGELADLSPIIRPDIAIITKIAPAHLAFFENVEEIADAKAEIFDGMVVGGTAILNRDDTFFEHLSAKAKSKGLHVLSVGEADGSDVQIKAVKHMASGVSADLHIKGQTHKMSVKIPGPHWVFNGACAVTAAYAAGIKPAIAVKALAKLKPLAGRGETLKVKLAGKHVTLIDDSYNANPESMRAAIAGLAHQAGKSRKITVLGDMFELGKNEVDLHAALAEPLTQAGVSRVITTGECMRALRGAIPRYMRAAWARDYHMALDALEHEVEDGDFILVKGSNSVGLGKLVADIKKQQKGLTHAV